MDTLSITWSAFSGLVAHIGTTFRRGARGRRWVVLIIHIVLAAALCPFELSTSPVRAARPDVYSLYDMMQHGNGVEAVAVLRAEAEAVGGWQPAPGDRVVYDATIPWWTRAEVSTADMPPGECAIPKLSKNSVCSAYDPAQEPLVRFGKSTFANRSEDGTAEPRPVLDDLLATYVEEVGHSWQEYLYETEGRGHGKRMRSTTWEAAMKLIPGREYQVKRYILSLDGTLLELSTQERGLLLAAICDPDGYANPVGQDIPAYGAPSGWPHPAGWPTSQPAPEELAAFCSAAK